VRDYTRIDQTTQLPYCYGYEDADSNTCLLCELQQVCREVGAAVAPTSVSFSQPIDDDDDDDLEFDDFEDGDDE
jgi:hypothetical protein